MNERMFPVSWPYEFQKRWAELGAPKAVPWALVKAHERQAMINHDQTLEVLAKRGGLDPVELLYVLYDKPVPFSTAVTIQRYELDIEMLRVELEKFERSRSDR